MGAVASARLRQITIIVAVESVIWRTEVGIASLIRAPGFDFRQVMMSALGPSRKPQPPVVAAAYWGTAVAGPSSRWWGRRGRESVRRMALITVSIPAAADIIHLLQPPGVGRAGLRLALPQDSSTASCRARRAILAAIERPAFAPNSRAILGEGRP
jgi:hypothetical protein